MTDQEINEAVARKMGWTSVSNYHNHEWSGLPPGVRPKPENELGSNFKVLPDYCHSIEAAWEIAEKAVRENFRVVIAWRADHWFVQFSTRDIQQSFSAEAPSAPRAICLAFLKLKEETCSHS